MSKNVQEQIDILIQIQGIENKINAIRLRLAEEDKRVGEFDSELNASDLELTTRQSELDELKERSRSYESDSTLFADQISKSNAKLPAIKTNKEYQSVLKEMDDLKSKIAENDEKIIACMENIEAQEKNIAEQQITHKELEKKIKSEKKSLKRESKSDREDFQAFNDESARISEELDPALLKQFVSIQKYAHGIAITRVINATCQACNMNIPPQMYNELQACDSFKRCPFCQRIIYWKKPSEEEQEK